MLKKKPATPRNETYLPVRVSMARRIPAASPGAAKWTKASTVHGS